MVASDLVGDLSLSNKVFFRGVPAACSAEDVSALLQRYGPLDCICYEKGSGAGFAEFLFCGSAERAEEESNRSESELSLAGKRLEVQRGAPRKEGSTDTGAFQQALVKPQPRAEKLDVAIVRGHATATSIGMVAELAKAKTTTLVLWDGQHRPKVETKAAASLEKRVYTEVFAEQAPDKEVVRKAEQFFSVGAPKCALVHVTTDKLKSELRIERPLAQANELTEFIKHNHIESIHTFNGLKVYKPWIQANRACSFVLIPPNLSPEWDGDIATCVTGTRRIVRADALRLPDGSGWSMGLQMTNSSAASNSALAFASVRDVVFASEEVKHKMAGRTLELGMPTLTFVQQDVTDDTLDPL